jgi:hypothetical protein
MRSRPARALRLALGRCDNADRECRRSARERDRSHLGIAAMVDDHHHCKALCEVTRA